MICPNYSDPQYLIFSTDVPALLYYSHFTSIFVSLFLGLFVVFKNRDFLEARLLFLISLFFSSWGFINLITWTNNGSDLIIFVWNFFGLFFSLICITSFYFTFVFINKSYPGATINFILMLLLLPVIIFLPTNFNIESFNLELCGVTEEGFYYTSYYWRCSCSSCYYFGINLFKIFV